MAINNRHGLHAFCVFRCPKSLPGRILSAAFSSTDPLSLSSIAFRGVIEGIMRGRARSIIKTTLARLEGNPNKTHGWQIQKIANQLANSKHCRSFGNAFP
jgi:hypothetical protein